ncbi:MAG: diacylglyceryl transferase [Bacteroidetes bacterium]|nr:diacylglyceryl transferase [Bacteroidota bacterium]
MEKLKLRWEIDSNFQLLVIFFVFAITGSTATFLSQPVTDFLGITKENLSLWLYWPFRIMIIFPVYQVLLVFFGFIFGQFPFFWKFEKKMLNNMRLGFIVRLFEK